MSAHGSGPASAAVTRSLDQLIERDEPAWDLVTAWAREPGANPSVLLPPDPARREETLLRLQVTTRSTLGAIAYESGGITLHDGWLRLLGSGQGAEARSLPDWNDRARATGRDGPPDHLLIADDVLGGFFALNGGRFGRETLGRVFHLAPDALDWEDLELGHTDFVRWCFLGDMRDFYADLDDLGCWEARPRPGFDQAFSFYPFLWTREGQDRRAVDRSAVGIDEIWRLKAGFGG